MFKNIQDRLLVIAQIVEGISISSKDVSAMRNSEINKELGKIEKQNSQLMSEFIAAGRGNEKPSEYLVKNDPLALRARALYDRRYELRNEISRRYGPNAPSRLPTRRTSEAVDKDKEQVKQLFATALDAISALSNPAYKISESDKNMLLKIHRRLQQIGSKPYPYRETFH